MMKNTCGCHRSYRKAKNKADRLSPQNTKRLCILFAALAIVVVSGVLFAPGKGVLALLEEHRRIQEGRQNNTKLEQDIKTTEQQIDSSKRDPEFMEGLARADFNMVQPDEIILDYSKKK
ncbi:MAG: septum formation initiator family protein [Desulfobulbaceae bacterium]|jgi:cell division protein FtsB|nr:septum formation initiator family protein [Desulfobulbaceae bacterium]